MRIPKFLEKGGTIGFIAPSFGCNMEPYKSAFENAQKKFDSMGYKLSLGPNCYAGEGVGISNTPEKCGAEMNEYLANKKVDAIISCGGGELMCETLDYADFKGMAEAEPTWYMGYSDNTNLTFLLPTLCDTAAIYAPCVNSFGMEPWHQSITDAFDILTGETDAVKGYDMWEKESLKDEEHPFEPYNLTEKRILKSFNANGKKDENIKGADLGADVELSGRMIGGCMDCLANLVGTKFDKVKAFNERYRDDGIIWFMEACELNPMSIRRALWQLKHAGWFEHLKGFLIGRPLCYGEEQFDMSTYQAVTAALGDFGVPIIMDLDIGHLSPMMPVISGSMSEVKAHGNDIEIRYLFK